MKGELPSHPPASVAAPTSEWGSLRSGALRSYRDDAMLDRVRQRLDARPMAARRPRVFWQAAAALVVFGLGIGVGRSLPSVPMGKSARAEITRATAETRTSPAATPRDRSQSEREPRARPVIRRAERKRLTAAPQLDHVLPAPITEAIVADAPLAEDEALTAATVPTAPRSTWLTLAEAGDYASALAELEQSQAAHLVLATGSVEELMTMAEVARFAGNQERAIQALSQVVDRYRSDPNAPLAAMMLGNLLIRSGDSEGAARAFALNRTLSPGGDFAEDALVREFDLALAAGNTTLAASLFDQYAREFPAGPHLYAMRYELDELLADSEETPRSEALPVPTPERGEEAPDAQPPVTDED